MQATGLKVKISRPDYTLFGRPKLLFPSCIPQIVTTEIPIIGKTKLNLRQ